MLFPPHNPMEAMSVVKYKVENRMNETEDSIDELLKIMPAPDFPTGGYIHGASNMREAWEKGTGKIFLRACWDVEETNGRSVVSIREIPYQVNKLNLVTKMKDLSKVESRNKNG